MKLLLLPTLFSTLLSLTLAQFASIPACALPCFSKAIEKSGCALTDFYCQCTTGGTEIRHVATDCLCASEGTSSGCSAADLLKVQAASNNICSSALAVSSQTYTPMTAKTCPTASAGSSSATATGTGIASSSATATGSSAASASASAASGSGSASASASANAAVATKMPMAVIGGLAGVAMMAL